MAVNNVVATITIPPAPPTGIYDADFQTKVSALLDWYNTHAVEETTFIEILNVFIAEINGVIPLVNNGLQVQDYLGTIGQTFYVGDATDDNHAVNLKQAKELMNVTTYSLTADTPISFSNISVGVSSWSIELATNGFTVTWDANVVWDGDGTEPDWTTGADLVYFYSLDGGTTVKGMMVRAGA